jgi:hypothetical protein
MKRPPFPRDEVESRISGLLDLAEPFAHRELVSSLLRSAARLPWDDTSRLDLKILNAAVRELRRSFRTFAPYRSVRKVGVFGSARTPEDHPLYHLAVLHGICFQFGKRRFSRLRQLIDAINAL